ncbi:MAG TPA: protein kinase [Edaphobacter sp.]
MTLPTGVRIGSYEILSAIGAGGMGEVYLSRDSRLGRDVAIKVLPEAFSRDPGRMLRFQREAKLLASLNHPNIASIYGIEDSNGVFALVMEYVDGPTLSDRILSGPIPVDEALKIARQIADALEYAHEHGIIHRDLKPANVKVTPDDAVKILDFGLAKAVQGEIANTDIGNSPTISEMATQVGVPMGTAGYMSPEQAKGKPVDRRTDIWAFGCVLYEMLTGKPAFRSETLTETFAAVLRNEPDWSLLPAETPIRVRVLLQRCLQKDPKQRLRDIGDARISLDEVLSSAPDPALAGTPQDPATRWRSVLPWAVSTLLLFAASAWLAFVHLREKPPAAAPPIRFQIASPEKTSLGDRLALSPDGRHLAFITMAQDGSTQLWLRDLDSLVSRPLPGTDGAGFPFWSPDSRSVAFPSGRKLKRVDISGGAPQVICSFAGFLLGGAWNPDGIIVFGSDKGLMKVSAAGGEPSVLIKARRSLGESWLGYPSFLPDERHFLYSGLTGSRWVAHVGSLDAGDQPQSTEPLAAGAVLAGGLYVPTLGTGPGSIVFKKPDRTLVAQAFDASRMELKGDPSPLAEGVDRFTVSANGVLAYTVGNPAPIELTWFDRQGKVLGTVGEPGIYPSPAISPDGRTVAVSLYDRSAGRVDLWLYDLHGGRRTRFTLDGTANLFPVWSPDGSRIAFYSIRKGFPTVYQKPVNGVGQEEPFETDLANPTRPLDWSLDGRYLIKEARGDTLSIWVLPLSSGQTGTERKSAPWLNEGFNVCNARLSPDGKWIAYDSDESGRDEIFVRTFPNLGGKWQVSTNGGTRPLWSRNGKELYYIASDGKLMAVDVKRPPDDSFDAGAAKALFDAHTTRERTDTFDVTKDGRFLIPTMTQQAAPPITVVVNWQTGLK